MILHIFSVMDAFRDGDYYSTSEFPKFRLTGTAPSGDHHPVIFQKEIFNVNSFINGGTFLCTRPGYYHFSAALSADKKERTIALKIMHNGRGTAYARFFSKHAKYPFVLTSTFKGNELWICACPNNFEARAVRYGECQETVRLGGINK